MFSAEFLRHRSEVARALASHKYEVNDYGFYIPSMKANVGGVMDTWLNYREHQVHKNLMPVEGRDYMLDVAAHGAVQVGTWFTALYEDNATPASTWTGGNFNSVANEFTQYDELLRPEYDEAPSANGVLTNSANRADFTIATGVLAHNLYGAALLESSAKLSVTGKLLAASAFSAPRVVNATDILSVQYTLTLTST